ncbi:MAG: hypothetical protein WB609_04135, partial [Candidatus Cybelea sp.]
MTTINGWRETYEGGSPEAERLAFERFALTIMGVQITAERRAKASAVQRAFHAKTTFATTQASLDIDAAIPADLCAGWVQPGRSYPVIVRCSNASSVPQGDAKPDLRGVALRVEVSKDEHHDLLMTNFPVSHARNAHQFVAFAKAT